MMPRVMMMRRIAAVAAILTVFTSSGAAAADTCERAMQGAAAAHDVPLGVLYAVGLTESGRRSSLHPYAMNIAGEPFFGASLEDSLTRFSEARAQGIKLIDVGCMQINYHYHGSAFGSVREMFEPAANVAYGARFLRELREREGSWTMAVARYHAGPDNDPAQQRYVCRVIENLVATGFGAWTPGARSFCGKQG